MLWKGFDAPAPVVLPVFSCPELAPPKPINPSLSSLFFLRPQIRYATTPNPARMMAPPTPTTTPMMVFLVFELMPDEDELPLLLRAAVPVGSVEVTVDEVNELVTLPSIVVTNVLTTTAVVLVGVTEEVVFVLAFSVEVELAESEVEAEVLVGVEESEETDSGAAEELEDGGVVVAGVLELVVVGGTLSGVEDADADVDGDEEGVTEGEDVVSDAAELVDGAAPPGPDPVPVAWPVGSAVPASSCLAATARP